MAPQALQVTLVGLAAAFAAGGWASEGKSARGVCAGVPALASAGFVLVVCPLALKTWRLNTIFNSKDVRVRRITTDPPHHIHG